jgi:predicted metal-dependent peptidase
MAKDWETAVINAAKQAQNSSKNAGKIPAYFQRMIDELVNPLKDWRILLREFIEPEPTDYTFIRPDTRIDYDTFGCFLPSFNEEEEKVEDIYFWIDTSGSVSNEDLQYIYSEVAGAINQFDKFTGYLGFFDYVAYEPKHFEDFNSLKEIIPQGGGGTNFHAPFNWLNDNNINPKCVIMLTDGYCDFPETDIIDCPVIWLITTKGVEAPEPWRTIYLPLEEHSH